MGTKFRRTFRVATISALIVAASTLLLGMLSPLATAQSIAQQAESQPAPRAIQCAAALELMARAAPSWSSQDAAIEARTVWYQEARVLASVLGHSADKQISQEMTLLAEVAVERPNLLSDMALSCVADAPAAS